MSYTIECSGPGATSLPSPIASEIISRIPQETATTYRVLPVKIEGDILLVACSDPPESSIIRESAVRAACNPAIGVGCPSLK